MKIFIWELTLTSAHHYQPLTTSSSSRLQPGGGVPAAGWHCGLPAAAAGWGPVLSVPAGRVPSRPWEGRGLQEPLAVYRAGQVPQAAGLLPHSLHIVRILRNSPCAALLSQVHVFGGFGLLLWCRGFGVWVKCWWNRLTTVFYSLLTFFHASLLLLGNQREYINMLTCWHVLTLCIWASYKSFAVFTDRRNMLHW